MTRRVYKYLASDSPGSVMVVPIQKGSVLRCGRLQDDCPVFWFEVDSTETEYESWVVTVVFTGQDLPAGMEAGEYAGTDIGSNGLVWHFYARRLDG